MLNVNLKSDIIRLWMAHFVKGSLVLRKQSFWYSFDRPSGSPRTIVAQAAVAAAMAQSSFQGEKCTLAT